jgi:hypothetical protein
VKSDSAFELHSRPEPPLPAKRRGIAFVPQNEITLKDAAMAFQTEYSNTVVLHERRLALGTPDLGKPFLHKTKQFSRNTVVNILFFKKGRYFYKKYTGQVKKTESKDELQRWFKLILNEADCQLYANGIMRDCHFRTPLLYRVFFDVRGHNEITFSIMLQMERIPLNFYKIRQTFNQSDLERLAPVEQCLLKHGIVHDDLAPRNVGIHKDEILLIDWGESFFKKDAIHTQNRNHLNLNW